MAKEKQANLTRQMIMRQTQLHLRLYERLQKIADSIRHQQRFV